MLSRESYNKSLSTSSQLLPKFMRVMFFLFTRFACDDLTTSPGQVCLFFSHTFSELSYKTSSFMISISPYFWLDFKCYFKKNNSCTSPAIQSCINPANQQKMNYNVNSLWGFLILPHINHSRSTEQPIRILWFSYDIQLFHSYDTFLVNVFCCDYLLKKGIKYGSSGLSIEANLGQCKISKTVNHFLKYFNEFKIIPLSVNPTKWSLGRLTWVIKTNFKIRYHLKPSMNYFSHLLREVLARNALYENIKYLFFCLTLRNHM